MSDFSVWARKTFPFFYNPIQAVAARQASSTNPSAQAIGKEVLSVVTSSLVSANQSVQSGNSVMAAGSSLVADLENGANQLVAGYVSGMTAGVPFVGGLLAPEAKQIVLAGLVMGENHLHTMIAALFAHHTATVHAATGAVPKDDTSVKPPQQPGTMAPIPNP